MAYDQIMVDLETLGVQAGAAIVSIGAVRFSLLLGEDLMQPREWKIRIGSKDLGIIEPGTVSWWFQQSKEAIDETFNTGDRVAPEDAMSGLAAFIDHGTVEGFWSNGPTFDELLLRSAWERFGMDGDFPIHFRASRDYRTIRAIGAAAKITPVPFEGVKHSAMADALNQALNVREVFKWLRRD